MNLKLGLVLTTLICGIQAKASTYLNIGDPAPSIASVKWLKGQPIPTLAKGKVYVVEFWATWCGPCKANIPNLTALAKKYDGKVAIIGIDIWESTDPHDMTAADRVATFVEHQGDKMDYHVAVDNHANDIANNWMKAAGEGGIPESFVIGKDGKIAWMGHAEGLDQVLAAVVDDKFDVQAARARRTTEVEVIRPVAEAMAAKDFKKALSLMDTNVAKKPEMARFYQYDRYVAYAHLDLNVAKSMSAQLLKDSDGDIGVYQMISSVYASQPDLSPEAYAYGLTVIQEALAKKDREYLFFSMAGAVSKFLHQTDQAIDYAKKAVAAAEKDPHAPAPFVEFLKRTLADLQANKG